MKTGSEQTGNLEARLFGFLFATVVVGFSLWTAIDPLNPDWLAYQRIYQDGGGWLADQGRDPLFLFIIGLAYEYLGSQGYEEFRTLLSLYFLAFAGSLAAGYILPVARNNVAYYAVSIAVISLVLSRFSIQIREGLAVTFALVALAFTDRIRTYASIETRLIFGALAITAWVCAIAIHFGILPLALIGVGALLISEKATWRRSAIYLKGTVYIFGILQLAYIAFDSSLTDQIIDFSGDREVEYISAGIGHIILWGGYGIAAVQLHRVTQRQVRQGLLRGKIAVFATLLTGPFAMISILSVYVLLALGMPTLQVVLYARLISLLLSVGVIIVATKCERLLSISFPCALIVSDQFRAVWNAVEATVYGS